MGRKKKRGLFDNKEPKHPWIAKNISLKSPSQAKKGAERLLKALKRGMYKRLKIGQKRALAIARGLQQAANRAKASAKKKDLSKREKQQLRKISKILDKAAEKAFKIYEQKYRGS